MTNDPVFVEIYSPRDGVWAWAVTFNDLSLSQSGKVAGFPQAVRAVLDAFENAQPDPTKCRVCGCTDANCSGCVARTGIRCSWVEPDLCSACVDAR